MTYAIGQEWTSTHAFPLSALRSFGAAMAAATGYGVPAGDESYHDSPPRPRRRDGGRRWPGGLQSQAVLTDRLIQIFGAAFVESGELSMRFVAPVYAGDTVSTSIRITKVSRCPRRPCQAAVERHLRARGRGPGRRGMGRGPGAALIAGDRMMAAW